MMLTLMIFFVDSRSIQLPDHGHRGIPEHWYLQHHPLLNHRCGLMFMRHGSETCSVTHRMAIERRMHLDKELSLVYILAVDKVNDGLVPSFWKYDSSVYATS